MNAAVMLAVETSDQVGSVALSVGDRVATLALSERSKHSESLLPAIETLLDRAGLTFDDLTALAFTLGPGSFTGLRVAAGVVGGIAMARDLPVVGIGTLEAAAQTAARETGGDRFVVVSDARMNGIFLAAYRRREDGWVAEIEPLLTDLGHLPPPPPGAWRVVGPIEQAAALADRWGLPPAGPVKPDAKAVIELAGPRLARGEFFASPEDIRLVYLRNKVARTMAEQGKAR